MEEILNSRRYRCKLQYLIKWKGYSDAHNSWEPKENVTAPALLAAYHEQNAAVIRKLEMEQAGCSQSTLSLGPKERTTRALPQKDEHPLEPKREPIRHFGIDSRCHQKTKEALGPDSCAQNGNQCIQEETKTQPKMMPRKVTGFVQRLRAIFLRPFRKPCIQEKTGEEPEECKCSICKRNKGVIQGATEPLKTHTPAPMTIRSIRIDQKRHRISTLGTIQEEERPNRRTSETGTEKTTETLKSYQKEEGGQKAELQKQDKRQTRTGEQEASRPIHLAPHIAHSPHMHGSPCANRQRYPIRCDSSGSASSPMTVSGVDMSRMPHLPRTSPSPTEMEATPILSETLWTPPTAPIPPTTASTDTDGAQIIRRAQCELISTSKVRANSSRVPPAEQDASWHLSVAEDLQTQQPLRHDEKSVIVRLPQHPSYLLPCAGPVTHTCCSSPHPVNIILQAPCDLSLPWINQLTFHYAGVYCMHNKY